ncbi:type III-A CRISPR-associated RAMP protein Csm5 [Proteiniphilum propionicum]|jgi:CRISPR-associated protein Csm5|uniref:type III-A CRISPR-associated RAMP protein Csm5 n=1 Tax=Proteiniphilum propionicum TaxID=2829812 RepID=UPI001EECE255|nr:type III-A CRISPR-associated RAMP protein Csm5 [Proteiniphilum propionicum]ULB35860.1 type III-A CRISPR-associated RAMP protein Csm5 [Proteiniphilum propionicum]
MSESAYRITTLTPVSIGDGNTLSAFADYVLEKGKIHYINQQAIRDKMGEKSELIDIYVEGMIRGKSNTTNAFNLKDFIVNRLKLTLQQAASHSIDACSVGGKKELYTVVKNVGQSPYIPGSTLKGAIKTALLYDWLINEDEGQLWCSQYVNDFNNEELNKRLILEFDKFELAVSDSSLMRFDALEAIEIKRLNIKKGTLDIPQTREAIKDNNTCECEIRNVRKLIEEKVDGTKVYKNYSWEEFCEIINKFSDDSCNIEWEIMESFKEKLDNKYYKRLENFYSIVQKKAENNTTAYLRLGAGKGFYFNSVALSLFDTDTTDDKSRFLKLLKANGYGKVYKPQTRREESYDLKADQFPITRFVEIIDTKPLGWVKIEKIDNYGKKSFD